MHASAAPVGVQEAETVFLGCSLFAAMNGLDIGPASFDSIGVGDWSVSSSSSRIRSMVLTTRSLVSPIGSTGGSHFAISARRFSLMRLRRLRPKTCDLCLRNPVVGHQRLIEGQFLHVEAREDRIYQELQTGAEQFCSKSIQDLNLEMTFTFQAQNLRDMLPKEMWLNGTAVQLTTGHNTRPPRNRGDTGRLFCWSFAHEGFESQRHMLCPGDETFETMISGVATSSTVLGAKI